MLLMNQKPGCWNTSAIGLNEAAVRINAIHTSRNGRMAVVKRINGFFMMINSPIVLTDGHQL